MEIQLVEIQLVLGSSLPFHSFKRRRSTYRMAATVEDLSMLALEDINERTIDDVLQDRYENKSNFYSAVGNCLVFVNPYPIFSHKPAELPLSANIMQKYSLALEDSAFTDHHLYKFTENIRRSVTSELASEAIVFRGCSGSGKTESLKAMVQYLLCADSSAKDAATTTDPDAAFHPLGSQRNPFALCSDTSRSGKIITAGIMLMSALGSTPTDRNRHCSVHIKHIRMVYGISGRIIGAQLRMHLTDMIKLGCKDANSPKPAYLFCLFIAGIGSRADEFKLTNTCRDIYNNVIQAAFPDENLEVEFTYLEQTVLQSGALTSEEWNQLLRVIAGIALLQSVSLVGSESTIISSNSKNAVLSAEHNLGLDEGENKGCLSHLFLKRLDDRIGKNTGAMIDNKPAESRAILESVCSNIYSRTISYMLQQITSRSFADAEAVSMSPLNELHFLDAPGWDAIPSAMYGLPHLMYNYCEEKMHVSYFQQVFAGEIKRYALEDIHLSAPPKSLAVTTDAIAGYPTNLAHVEMMERSSGGILNLFEDSTLAPKFDEKGLVEKVLANHSEGGRSLPAGRPALASAAGGKAKPTVFVINHSFGEIHYDCEGFLLMNKSGFKLSKAAHDVLATSTVSFLADDGHIMKSEDHAMIKAVAKAKAQAIAGTSGRRNSMRKSIMGLFPTVEGGGAASSSSGDTNKDKATDSGDSSAKPLQTATQKKIAAFGAKKGTAADSKETRAQTIADLLMTRVREDIVKLIADIEGVQEGKATSTPGDDSHHKMSFVVCLVPAVAKGMGSGGQVSTAINPSLAPGVRPSVLQAAAASEAASRDYNSMMMQTQIQHAALAPLLGLAQRGFPYVSKYAEFYEKYRSVLPSDVNGLPLHLTPALRNSEGLGQKKELVALCKTLVEEYTKAYKIAHNGASFPEGEEFTPVFGTTSIFMKSSLSSTIEQFRFKKAMERNSAARLIQSIIRMRKVRRLFQKQRVGVVKLQSLTRCNLRRGMFLAQKYAINKIKAVLLMSRFRKQFRQERAAVNLIKSKLMSGMIFRIRYKRLQRAAHTFQNIARGFIIRRNVMKATVAVGLLQRCAKAFLIRRRKNKMSLAAALKFQCIFRGWRTRSKNRNLVNILNFRREQRIAQVVVKKLQARWRGKLVKLRMEEIIEATLKLQNWLKCRVSRNKFVRAKLLAIWLQKIARRYIAINTTNALRVTNMVQDEKGKLTELFRDELSRSIGVAPRPADAIFGTGFMRNGLAKYSRFLLAFDICFDLEFAYPEGWLNQILSFGKLMKFGDKKSMCKVAMGSQHTVILDDMSNIYTFGLGDLGQLGHNHRKSYSKPRNIEKLPVYLSLTETSGAVNAARIGSGTLPVHSGMSMPGAVLQKVLVRDVACGHDHTLLLTGTGRVYSWGDNRRGQLGQGRFESCSYPKLVGGGAEIMHKMHKGGTSVALKHVVQISCGAYHSACVADPGTLYTWGRKECLGREAADSFIADNIIPGGGSTVHGGSVHGGGSVRNGGGSIALARPKLPGYSDEPGRGLDPGDSCEPGVLPFFKGKRVQFAACGESHITVKCWADLYSWGLNGHGQLGNGTTTPSLTPVLVLLTKVKKVGQKAGTPKGGPPPPPKPKPPAPGAPVSAVPPPAPKAHSSNPPPPPPPRDHSHSMFSEGDMLHSDLLTGGRHMMLLIKGEMYLWGWNKYGQIGNGSSENALTPVNITIAAANAMSSAPPGSSPEPNRKRTESDAVSVTSSTGGAHKKKESGAASSTEPLHRYIRSANLGWRHTLVLASGEAPGNNNFGAGGGGGGGAGADDMASVRSGLLDGDVHGNSNPHHAAVFGWGFINLSFVASMGRHSPAAAAARAENRNRTPFFDNTEEEEGAAAAAGRNGNTNLSNNQDNYGDGEDDGAGMSYTSSEVFMYPTPINIPLDAFNPAGVKMNGEGYGRSAFLQLVGSSSSSMSIVGLDAERIPVKYHPPLSECGDEQKIGLKRKGQGKVLPPPPPPPPTPAPRSHSPASARKGDRIPEKVPSSGDSIYGGGSVASSTGLQQKEFIPVFKHTPLPHEDMVMKEVDVHVDSAEVTRRFKELGALTSPVMGESGTQSPANGRMRAGDAESKSGCSTSSSPELTAGDRRQNKRFSPDKEKWTGKRYERLNLELDREKLVDQFSPLQFSRIKNDRLLNGQHRASAVARSQRMQKLSETEAVGVANGISADGAYHHTSRRGDAVVSTGGSVTTGSSNVAGVGMPKSERAFLTAFAVQRSKRAGGSSGRLGVNSIMGVEPSLDEPDSPPLKPVLTFSSRLVSQEKLTTSRRRSSATGSGAAGGGFGGGSDGEGSSSSSSGRRKQSFSSPVVTGSTNAGTLSAARSRRASNMVGDEGSSSSSVTALKSSLLTSPLVASSSADKNGSHHVPVQSSRNGSMMSAAGGRGSYTSSTGADDEAAIDKLKADLASMSVTSNTPKKSSNVIRGGRASSSTNNRK